MQVNVHEVGGRRERKEKERIEGINSAKLGIEKPHHNIVSSNHYLNCPVWNPGRNDKIFTVVRI